MYCRFGPLVSHWTMRFEAKHNWFKGLAQQLGNYTNLPYTLSMRYQQLQCYQLCGGQDTLAEHLDIGPGKMVLGETVSVQTRQVYRYYFCNLYIRQFVLK